MIDSLSTATYSASASYQYDAYGNRVGSSAGTAAVSPYGYDGYYTDSESGLCYLNARYYDPSTQCFTQEDTYWGTVDDPGSRNLYGYCQDNPVNRADYNGHYSPADDGTGRSVEYVGTDNKKVVNPGNKIVTVTVNENATVKQLNTYLGVRGENDDSAPEIGSINSGERVQVISDDGYFAYVRYHIKAYPYYKEGFVHSRYLDKGGATKAATQTKAASDKSKTTSKSKTGKSPFSINPNSLSAIGTAGSIATESSKSISGTVNSMWINAIKNAKQPNNIGTGTWNKYIASELEYADRTSGMWKNIFDKAGYVVVLIDFCVGTYSNCTSGHSANKIAYDTSVDVAFDATGIVAVYFADMGAGAIAGSLIPVPGVGTAVGAATGLIVGIVYSCATDAWEPINGESAREYVKSLYN